EFLVAGGGFEPPTFGLWADTNDSPSLSLNHLAIRCYAVFHPLRRILFHSCSTICSKFSSLCTARLRSQLCIPVLKWTRNQASAGLRIKAEVRSPVRTISQSIPRVLTSPRLPRSSTQFKLAAV